MSVTASSRAERWLFSGWVLFAAVNVALMFDLPGEETIPFHFVWISLALVYGIHPWTSRRTLVVLCFVCALTGAALAGHVRNGVIGWEETTEVPLMTMVFLAMVWHVRRRIAAVHEAHRHADSERRIRDAQRRFVRFASHELRTPLTVARGYAELIREQAVLPQVREDTAIVLEELDKLTRISTRLLTLAQLDERSTLLPERIDFDLLLQQTIKRWGPVADRLWRINTDAGSLVGDADRLITALDSLLDNAVRYTDAGGRIAITAHRDGADVLLEVLDDGIGIPPDELPFVFDSFRSGSRGGTGMGLAIVKAVVQAHGGSVRAVSREGYGSAFIMAIPVAGPTSTATSGTATPGTGTSGTDTDRDAERWYAPASRAAASSTTTPSTSSDASPSGSSQLPTSPL
ncbi:MAG: two-component sensor histidine kinase [Pseudonocardiales bacterium]|nr:two-component sensor histidine kinase [Pseudonocardiales bacterium]